jgi:hypothetical protein
VIFSLTYDGPLKAAASQSDKRRLEKQQIRCALHLQLMQLWKSKDVLHEQFLAGRIIKGGQEPYPITKVELIPQAFVRGEFNLFPIVRKDLHLVCDLDILFLRREEPGELIVSGGDLDNRIKTLFDALRVPTDDNEVRGYKPAACEQPVFLCLTEDDKLITGFRISTDRLLEPAACEAQQNNVRLIIRVEVKATKLTQENLGYFAHF